MDYADVFNDDGTLRGMYYCAESGKRPQCIQVYLPNQEPGKRRRLLSVTLHNVGFYEQYAFAARELANASGVERDSELFAAMLSSHEAFVHKYKLKLYPVQFMQAYKPK